MKAALFDVGHTTAHAVHVVAYHDDLDHRLELRDLVGRNLVLVIVVDHFLDFQVMWRKGRHGRNLVLVNVVDHFLDFQVSEVAWRKGHRHFLISHYNLLYHMKQDMSRKIVTPNPLILKDS